VSLKQNISAASLGCSQSDVSKLELSLSIGLNNQLDTARKLYVQLDQTSSVRLFSSAQNVLYEGRVKIDVTPLRDAAMVQMLLDPRPVADFDCLLKIRVQFLPQYCS
jgi:hypothetical protein